MFIHYFLSFRWTIHLSLPKFDEDKKDFKANQGRMNRLFDYKLFPLPLGKGY
jgi:hypothetical protein